MLLVGGRKTWNGINNKIVSCLPKIPCYSELFTFRQPPAAVVHGWIGSDITRHIRCSEIPTWSPEAWWSPAPPQPPPCYEGDDLLARCPPCAVAPPQPPSISMSVGPVSWHGGRRRKGKKNIIVLTGFPIAIYVSWLKLVVVSRILVIVLIQMFTTAIHFVILYIFLKKYIIYTDMFQTALVIC